MNSVLLQMAGFPGSGKSTLARIIGTKTGAIVIDHDIVKSALMEALKENEMNLNTAGKISYHIEWSLIDFHLSQGNSVIFDSPCFYSEMVEKGLSLANRVGGGD
ncbi:AAA family ATPase [Heyndrickxia sporothermodurans]